MRSTPLPILRTQFVRNHRLLADLTRQFPGCSLTRQRIIEVSIVHRRDPITADAIGIAASKSYNAAVGFGQCGCHGAFHSPVVLPPSGQQSRVAVDDPNISGLVAGWFGLLPRCAPPEVPIGHPARRCRELWHNSGRIVWTASRSLVRLPAIGFRPDDGGSRRPHRRDRSTDAGTERRSSQSLPVAT